MIHGHSTEFPGRKSLHWSRLLPAQMRRWRTILSLTKWCSTADTTERVILGIRGFGMAQLPNGRRSELRIALPLSPVRWSLLTLMGTPTTQDVSMDRFRLDAVISRDGAVCSILCGGCHKYFHSQGSFIRRSRGRESRQYLDLRRHDLDAGNSVRATSVGERRLRCIRSKATGSGSLRRWQWRRRPKQHMAMARRSWNLEATAYKPVASTAGRRRYDVFSSVGSCDRLRRAKQ
jgi:hypothetical protein